MPEPLWNRRRMYYLSWTRFDELCVSLHERILADGFIPDVILGIARGGMVPAVRLCHLFNVHALAFVDIRKNVSSSPYPARERARILSRVSVSPTARVLIVDDIAGSGETLSVAQHGIEVGSEAIRTATLLVNAHCDSLPDYYELCVDDWAIFPWEAREDTTRGHAPAPQIVIHL